MTYALIRQAILDKVSLTATYKGKVRHFCPHTLGTDQGGIAKVMTFQYGGHSTSRLPTGGAWRCFRVSDLRNVARNTDRFRSGTGHSRPNTCVTQVDVDAFPATVTRLHRLRHLSNDRAPV